MSKETSINAESQRVERRKRLKKRLLIDFFVFGLLGLFGFYIYGLYLHPKLVFAGYEQEGRFAKFVLRNRSLRTWSVRLQCIDGKPQPTYWVVDARGQRRAYNCWLLPAWQTNLMRAKWYNSVCNIARDLHSGEGDPVLGSKDFVLVPYDSLDLMVPMRSLKGLVKVSLIFEEESPSEGFMGFRGWACPRLDELWFTLQSQVKVHGATSNGEAHCFLPGAPTIEE